MRRGFPRPAALSPLWVRRGGRMTQLGGRQQWRVDDILVWQAEAWVRQRAVEDARDEVCSRWCRGSLYSRCCWRADADADADADGHWGNPGRARWGVMGLGRLRAGALHVGDLVRARGGTGRRRSGAVGLSWGCTCDFDFILIRVDCCCCCCSIVLVGLDTLPDAIASLDAAQWLDVNETQTRALVSFGS